MLTVAYVANYITENGPGKVILNLIENLDRTCFNPILITLFKESDSRIVEKLRKDGVSVIECKTLTRAKCLYGRSYEFFEVVEKSKVDILHTHGLIPDVLSSRLNLPLKKISTVHCNIFEDYRETYGFLKSRILIPMHICALKKMSVAVCCSQSVYDVLGKYLKNAVAVRNGIDVPVPRTKVTRTDLELPESSSVFIYAGGLTEGKNIVWLIKQFVNCHNENEYLLVLGSGPKEEQCYAVVDDHVRMVGFQTDPIAYMKISDFYISASKSEGFSISVLEALSCGLGLFLSDIPSHREIVRMGSEANIGVTFSQDDFKVKMEMLRKEIPRKKNIVEFLDRHLSASKMTGQYEQIYML